MAIGNFGTDIVFEVSSNKILTFKNYSETIGSRWADHAVQGSKPRSEFLGAELMTVNMTVERSAAHGVSPWQTREKIKTAIINGALYSLVIGGKQVSPNLFKIISAQDTFDQVLNDGKILKITMNLSFKENLR